MLSTFCTLFHFNPRALTSESDTVNPHLGNVVSEKHNKPKTLQPMSGGGCTRGNLLPS